MNKLGICLLICWGLSANLLSNKISSKATKHLNASLAADGFLYLGSALRFTFDPTAKHLFAGIQVAAGKSAQVPMQTVKRVPGRGNALCFKIDQSRVVYLSQVEYTRQPDPTHSHLLYALNLNKLVKGCQLIVEEKGRVLGFYQEGRNGQGLGIPAGHILKLAKIKGKALPLELFGLVVSPDTLQVSNILKQSPLLKNGLQIGEQIVRVNSRLVPHYLDWKKAVHGKKEVQVTVKNKLGHTKQITFKKYTHPDQNDFRFPHLY